MENGNKSKNMRKPILIVLALVIVGVGIAFFISGKSYETTDNAQIDGDILSVRSSVTAYVEDIHFEDNKEVHVGDTLIIFETTELKARVAQSEAALENAQASLASASNKAHAGVENVQAAVMNSKAMEESVAAAKANLTKAQKAYDRTVQLLDIKAATLEQKEASEAALAVAKADLARMTDQQKASQSSSSGLSALSMADQDAIELAAATVKQREAELALAKEQLSHAFVISPFNGVVTKRSVQEGQYVSMGQALCTVVRLDEVWVTANFKETQISAIQAGQDVEIEIDALKGKTFHGKVSSFSGATGSKFSLIPPDNATGNFIKVTQRFPIRISFEGVEAADKALFFPGLSAIVKVKVN